MSNNIMPWGKHEGRTFEWIFFNHPHYARYIKATGMPHQDNFGEKEARHFLELYRRANDIVGVCPQCEQRPIEYMGLTYHGNTHRLGGVGFYCEECEYLGGSPTGYHAPSFFLYEHKLSWPDQRRIAKEIKRVFIGRGNLTQKRMEEFFHNDANFLECTLGFFGPKPEAEVSK